MVEPKEVGAELMAAIERLRGLSTEEQEIAYVAFAEKYGAEVATKAKELFEVERAQPKAAEEPKKAPEVEEAIPEVEFHESDFAPEVVAPPTVEEKQEMLEWLANLRGIDPLAYAEKKSKWLVGWGLIKSLSKELSSRLETQDQERKRSNRK